MLTKFAVKNYRGFKDRIEWALSNPSNYSFNQKAIKDGFVKNGIIYGPNGSGKTNLSMALFDIVNHLTQKIKKPDYYKNFIYAGRPNGLVEFDYTFKLGEQVVEYSYAKSRDGKLINESLSVDGKIVFDHKGRELFVDTVSFPMDAMFKEGLTLNANNVSIVNVLLENLLPNRKVLNINTPRKQKVPKETNWKQNFQKPQNENIRLTYLNVEKKRNFPISSFCVMQ